MWPQGFKVCVVFFLICPADIIGLWWAVGSPLFMDPNRICRKSKRIGGKQREICLKEPEIVREIANGAKMAITECQYQFQNRRWNCPTRRRGIAKVLKLDKRGRQSRVRGLANLISDTREAAFVNAVTAAGVVFTVTQGCTMGLLIHCTCDHTIRDLATDGQWEWGGCGDDVNFGYLKSKQFMDVRKRKQRKSDIRTKLHLHNNEAGRLSVKEYMRTVCKCHGLSGSCTLKTCWRKMPIFRAVGQRLKDKFDGAVKVTISNDGAKIFPLGGGSIKPLSGEDLVYSSESPNYCVTDKKVGSQGTSGRLCDPTSSGVGGCDLLCCGKGFVQEKRIERENCKCRFRWCCEVICSTCSSEKTIYRCH